MTKDFRLQRVLTAAERRLDDRTRARLERQLTAANQTLDAALNDPAAAPETVADAETAFQDAYNAYFAATGHAWWPDTAAESARHEARPEPEAETS